MYQFYIGSRCRGRYLRYSHCDVVEAGENNIYHAIHNNQPVRSVIPHTILMHQIIHQ